MQTREAFERTGTGADTEIVGTPEYRRHGHALATLAVAVRWGAGQTATLPTTRLHIKAGGTALTLDPALLTRERPGVPHEQDRIWFVLDLSHFLTPETTFALVVGEREIALPDPHERGPWEGSGDEEPVAPDAAWSEAELHAVVTALEERCRVAERTAADARSVVEGSTDASEQMSKLVTAWREIEVLQELLSRRDSAYRALKQVLDAAAAERDATDAQIAVARAELERAKREATNRDAALACEVERARERAAEGRRMAEVVADTLAEVRTEREALIDKAARAVSELGREREEHEARMAEAQRTIEALQTKLQSVDPRPRRRTGLLARFQRGATAGPPEDVVLARERATIADLERRLEESESRAATLAQERERVENELGAQLEGERAELAVVSAALEELQARMDPRPQPTSEVGETGASPGASESLVSLLDAANDAAQR